MEFCITRRTHLCVNVIDFSREYSAINRTLLERGGVSLNLSNHAKTLLSCENHEECDGQNQAYDCLYIQCNCYFLFPSPSHSKAVKLSLSETKLCKNVPFLYFASLKRLIQLLRKRFE